ncbi:unnamed protein product, partial [Rotaria magnacalcarata]
MFPIPGVFAFPELFSNPGLDASGQYSEQAQILNEQIDTQNRVQIILESFLSVCAAQPEALTNTQFFETKDYELLSSFG